MEFTSNGFERKSIVRGCKDHGGLGSFSQQFKAGHSRHLNIQEHSIDHISIRKELDSLSGLDRFVLPTISTRCVCREDRVKRLRPRVHRQRGRHVEAGQRLIVVEQAATLCTIVPDSFRGNSTAPSSPKSVASRSLCRPCPAGEVHVVRKTIARIPDTEQHRPFPLCALTRISPPPYFTLFSTSVCRLKGGTSTCISVCGTSIVYCSRSPKRVFSILR